MDAEPLAVHEVRRPTVLRHLLCRLRHRQRQLVEIGHCRHGAILASRPPPASIQPSSVSADTGAVDHPQFPWRPLGALLSNGAFSARPRSIAPSPSSAAVVASSANCSSGGATSTPPRWYACSPSSTASDST